MIKTKKKAAGAKPASPHGKKQNLTRILKIKVIEVRNKLGLSQIELARVTGYALRSIAGWERGKPLSDSARRKLAETDRLRAALSEIVPPNELGNWLRTPNSAFEGQSPIQVIERGEADRLWRMLFQIDAGVASCIHEYIIFPLFLDLPILWRTLWRGLAHCALTVSRCATTMLFVPEGLFCASIMLRALGSE